MFSIGSHSSNGEDILPRLRWNDMSSRTTRHCTLPRQPYKTEIVRKLITAGADVHARNRFGDQPLHAAAVGRPNSCTWNPPAQAATIICLIEAGRTQML